MKRCMISFHDQAYETLKSLANRRGKSMAEVIRDALCIEVWAQQTKDEGGRLLIERPNGDIREILIR